jgi:hypothetical protein
MAGIFPIDDRDIYRLHRRRVKKSMRDLDLILFIGRGLQEARLIVTGLGLTSKVNGSIL